MPLLLADVHDEASVAAVAARAAVVLSLTGPYIDRGEAMLKACVQERTHYCDLSGRRSDSKTQGTFPRPLCSSYMDVFPIGRER